MFILLVPTEEKRSLLGLVRSPKIKLMRVEVRNAAPFFVMTCPKYKGTLPYNTISAVAGETRDRIVFPKNVTVPQSSPVKPFSSGKLKRRLIFNTALKILREKEEMCREKPLTVVDIGAAYRNEIDKLGEIAKEIEVITLFPEKYESAVKRLKLLNVNLSLKQGEKADRKDGIVISDNAECVTREFEGTLFSSEGKLPPYAECITGEGLDLSKYTDFEFPKEFDILDIAEAMYTLNFAGKLGDESYDKTIIRPPIQKMNRQTDNCK